MAASAADAEAAAQLCEILRNGVKDYLDPSDWGVFECHGLDAHPPVDRGDTSSSTSQTLSETTLVAHELAQLQADGAATGLRRRIEELTELNASLEKHLAMRTESRYEELMQASRSLMQTSSMRSLCEHYFPRLRSAFDDYTRASLHNVLSLPRQHARKSALKDLQKILEQIGTIGAYRGIVRCYDYCARHRIVAAAVAIHDIDVFIDRNPKASKLTVLRSLRDSFSSRLQMLIKNCAFKLDSGSQFRASVQLFHLLGISPESAASRVLCGYRRHIFGILLSTLQRYASLDSACSPAGSSHVDASTPGANTTPFSKSSLSDLVHYTRMLGPNMIILFICKVLSEFTSYLEAVASELERESSGDTFGSTTPLPEQLDIIQFYIRDLDDRGLSTYLGCILSVVRREFNSLRAYVCGLLATVIGDLNIHGVKDRNDYLKIGLLLRFFLLSQAECTTKSESEDHHRPPPAIGEEEGDDSESTCLAEDDLCVTGVDEASVDEVRKVLHSYGDVLLSTLPKDDPCYTNDPSHHLATLEEMFHTRLMVPYMEHFYQETLEKLSMSFAGDSCQRLAAPVGAVHERCDVFGLCVLMASRIRDNMRSYRGIRVCTLNPYNGWTPSSAFLGVNIDNWPPQVVHSESGRVYRRGSPTTGDTTISSSSSSSSATKSDDRANTFEHKPPVKGLSHESGMMGATTNPHANRSNLSLDDLNVNTATVGGQGTDAIESHGVTHEEWVHLYRNYGCVFTSSSFTLWSQLRPLFRVLILQPQRASIHVERLMHAFDWLLLRNVRSCHMSPDLGDLPHLRSFLESHGHLATEETSESDHRGSLSMLARLVNKVESVGTLLELLRRRLEFTCAKCTDTVAAHYNDRLPVVRELRVGVYPMCMLSLLKKNLPGDHIIKLLQRRHVPVPQACDDITNMMATLGVHFGNVREFIEAADCGSIPMPVKLMLWRYACLIVRSTMRPVLEFLDQIRARRDIVTVVTTGYKRSLDHCCGIFEAYRAEAGREVVRYRPVVAALAVYETVLQDAFNSRD